LTQKYQKVKAEYCIATKLTREIIPAIQAIRLVHLFFLLAFVNSLIGKKCLTCSLVHGLSAGPPYNFPLVLQAIQY
jgi:hypothetical protein